ncbi:MAG: hypothetical protein R2690_02310 [Acidimicrobiales bacterium]
MLAIAAFTAVAMVIVFAALKATLGLRVSEEEEIEGLDVHEHGVPGYAPDIAMGESGGLASSKEMATT